VVGDDDVSCHVVYLVTKSVHEYGNNLIKYVTIPSLAQFTLLTAGSQKTLK